MPLEEQESSSALGYDRSKVAEVMNGLRQGQEGGPIDISISSQKTPEIVVEQVLTDPIVEQEPVQEEVVPEVIQTKTVVEEQEPIVTDPIIDPVIPELDENDIVGVLQEAGLSVQSFQQIQEALAIKDQYTKTQKEFSGLSDDERRRIAVSREFGDATLYDRISAINADVIPDKEILRQIYFIENSGKSIDFLTKQFDRNYKKDYEEDEDEDFLKLKLAEDARLARETMKNFQEVLKSKTIGDTAKDQPIDDSVERQQAWRANADKILESNDRVIYTIGDSQISVPMDPSSKAIVQQAMYDPMGFIKEAISNEDGSIDHEALFEFIMRNVNFEKILTETKATSRANFQETQLKTLRNVEPAKTSTKIEAVAETPRSQFASFATNRRNV